MKNRTKMYNEFLGVAVIFSSLLVANSANGSIELSMSGDKFGVDYSARFEVDYLGSGVFGASLLNTTDASVTPEPLIHKFAWNMVGSPVLGTDFSITDVSPSSWYISEPNGNGVQFDYVGSSKKNANRLGAGDELTFKINFTAGLIDEMNAYSIFLNSDRDFGKGYGGGETSGQVVAHFQQLGQNGDSDLLGGDWENNSNNQFATPEPTSLAIFGIGACVMGFGASRRRRREKQEKTTT